MPAVQWFENVCLHTLPILYLNNITCILTIIYLIVNITCFINEMSVQEVKGGNEELMSILKKTIFIVSQIPKEERHFYRVTNPKKHLYYVTNPVTNFENGEKLQHRSWSMINAYIKVKQSKQPRNTLLKSKTIRSKMIRSPN